jgi:hypothetical protein
VSALIIKSAIINPAKNGIFLIGGQGAILGHAAINNCLADCCPVGVDL